MTNAPAAFQRQMNKIFEGLPFVLLYLDDILVFSASEEEHQKHVRQVLEILKVNKLYAKKSKCSFFEKSVKFLGHVISGEGVSVDPSKLDTILNWPEPKDSSDVRSFLGLGNHFKRFIQGYSKLTAPLVNLTESSVKFNFAKEAAQRAFKQLKFCLTKAPVLSLPAVDQPLDMICDASGFGVGAVLKQNNKAVAKFSHSMNKHERNYSVGEQELLAVVKAFHHWRCFLEGALQVTVFTDHKPNTFLTSKPAVQLTRRQVHWQEFL